MIDPSTSRPTPYAQLAISLAAYLGHCQPPLTEPAGVAPPSAEEEGERRQADMADFGFEGVGEVMDLCCAVRPWSSLSVPRQIGVLLSAPCRHRRLLFIPQIQD